MGRKGSNDAPEAREIKQNGNAKHKKTGVRAENVSGRKKDLTRNKVDESELAGGT